MEALRAKLAGTSGKKYWRSLEEVAETEEFERWLEDEFPNRSTLGQIDRRSLLKFMGASMALAGLSGCRGVFLPQDKVVPYVKQPEELVPGRPLFYASAMTLGGYAHGVLVEQHEGRPSRIEGNPNHPANGRSLDSICQAEILSLYDPDRTETVTYLGDISTWTLFDSAIRDALAKEAPSRGAGIRILTGATTSPTFSRVMERFQSLYPAAKWHSFEPAGWVNAHEGARQAFGRPVDTTYDFSKANIVVSLDADFLSPTELPGAFRYAKQFMDGRRVHGVTGTMNRLYAFESTPTLTGTVADHRWAVKPSAIGQLALAILGTGGMAGSPPESVPAAHFNAMVEDLAANRGRSIVVCGKSQPPEVHALVQRINESLGNVGSTVNYIAPVEANQQPNVGTLQGLVNDLNAGAVSTLIIIDSNPVYSAPVDLEFAKAMEKAPLKIHAGLYADETSAKCEWHLPMAHALEAWGDVRAYDGTASIVQPLIAPLFTGRSAIEIVSRLAGRPVSGYDLVRETWRSSGLGGGDFERFWNTSVHDGVIAGTASKPVAIRASASSPASVRPASGEGTMEVVFRADPTIYDGRYANNGWLQELPKPITKLTWDNAAIISPRTAQKLGVQDEDRVQLTVQGRKVEAAALVQPGHADDTVTVHLGYGRTSGGTVATASLNEEKERGDNNGGGFNAYAIRDSKTPDFAPVTIEKIGGLYALATTQGHGPLNDDRVNTAANETKKTNPIKEYNLDDRDIVRDFTLSYYTANIERLQEEWREKSEEYNAANMYPDQNYESPDLPQWGMTIDMNTCIGCNACVTACQSENNIPVVGKIQAKRHREMHWIRIDRYYSGDLDNPAVTYQPLMCVHCEKAPCEPVCPVAATVHSHDGLNMMVYNRCVGTRYCSNNCPYKVRKFNYLNFSDNQPNFSNVDVEIKQVPGPIHSPKGFGREMLRMASNPNVTVRGRGVMEKCTYCVQRISNARIEAKKAGRSIGPNEVVTACQQACPTNTIVFGNIADKESDVSRLREDPRAYLLLEELLTRPRTSHLAKLRNPNEKILSGAGA
jgi:molybdopterin-containing oxidoreductase family iron-sulfur binding subunit